MSKTCPTCTHILPTGSACGSPALRGEQFCFYHHPTRRPPTRTRASRTPFHVEPIVDAETLQMNLSEVVRRLADDTLDTRRASLILICLQMAKANLPVFQREAAHGAAPAAPAGPNFSDLSELLAMLGPQSTSTAAKP